MLKCDFHLHSSEDSEDRISHSAFDLVDAASERGYDAISITNHCFVTDSGELMEHARNRGLLLIPGVELNVGRKHVLAMNVSHEVEDVRTFHELRKFKEAHPEVFITAPHPYYPKFSCLWRRLDRNIDLFDAVEYCHFYLSFCNHFNEMAVSTARKYGKTVIANSDTHRMSQFGKGVTYVDSEKEIPAIIDALRNNRVRIETAPLSFLEVVSIMLLKK